MHTRNTHVHTRSYERAQVRTDGHKQGQTHVHPWPYHIQQPFADPWSQPQKQTYTTFLYLPWYPSARTHARACTHTHTHTHTLTLRTAYSHASLLQDRRSHIMKGLLIEELTVSRLRAMAKRSLVVLDHALGADNMRVQMVSRYVHSCGSFRWKLILRGCDIQMARWRGSGSRLLTPLAALPV